jgi:hypothetical protein
MFHSGAPADASLLLNCLESAFFALTGRMQSKSAGLTFEGSSKRRKATWKEVDLGNLLG